MRGFALLLAMVVAMPVAANRRRAVSVPIEEGTCTVRGLANLFVSFDGGATFSRNNEPPAFAGTRGVAVFEDEPQRLLIAVNSDVFDSTDKGCHWTQRYTVTDPIHHALRSVAAKRGRGYVWTEELAVRYDGGEVTPLILPEQIGALGVNPANSEHVRIAGLIRGQFYESLDGGASWKKIGAEAGGFVSVAAFDPLNFDHILIGVQSRGLLVTRDATRTWTPPASALTGNNYPCQLSFVSSSPNVVWAATVTRANAPAIFRSTNGGSQFEAIGPLEGVENGVCMPLEPDHFDSNRAVVPMGTLRTFDAVTKRPSDSSCCGGIDISRITFSPVDRNVIYVYGR